MERSTPKLPYYLSVILFVVSLTQPCYCTDNGCSDYFSGAAVLFSGTFGFFLCGAGFTWLANPALIISWYNRNNDHKVSFISSLVATILSLSFLLFRSVIVDEGGNYGIITKYQVGYWLWVLSSVIMLLRNVILWYTQRKESIVIETLMV